jgi:hypothetical protein
VQPSPEPPAYLLLFILIAFPTLFVTIWSFVNFILATTSGYRSLIADFAVEPETVLAMEELPTPWFVMLGWISYRGGTMGLRASREGLCLRVSRFFVFHPPVRIPWNRITPGESTGGGWGTRVYGGSILLDGRVRFRATSATLANVEAARARFAPNG